ncbi:NAC domain-containing protein 96-like [Lycium barbarum]|uniref:NAC domain-containing protein 96-like n=1 Tax=Lycium barbarum TaxID=112863 RepID=UPI00293EC61C|nr:NAC domain-containing protein 96-like [Lycium barbarum]
MAVYSDHSSRPMGYRFHPTAREVMKYLLGFVRNETLLEQYEVMQNVDLYANKDPWKIFEAYENIKNTRYFITPQKKGKGTWKSQNKGQEVFDDKGRLMGYVKSLKYIPSNKSSNNVNGEWLMTEYSLCDHYVDAGEIKNKGYIVCKIKKKEKLGDKRKENNANNIEVNDENMQDVAEYIDSVLQDDGIAKGEENITEYLAENEVEDHVLALLDCSDDEENIEECLDQGDEVLEHHAHANILRSAEDVDLDSINFTL